MHTLLDLRGSIPTFIYLTEAAVHDSKAMSLIPVEPGSYYLMDKGYVDFKQLFNHFHRQQAFFVTRAKDNMKYEVLEERPVDKQTGVISDAIIRLTGPLTSKWYPDTLRMVVYEDYATGNVYRFLTNDFTHSYLTIAELYRERSTERARMQYSRRFGLPTETIYCLPLLRKCIILIKIFILYLLPSGKYSLRGKP